MIFLSDNSHFKDLGGVWTPPGFWVWEQAHPVTSTYPYNYHLFQQGGFSQEKPQISELLVPPLKELHDHHHCFSCFFSNSFRSCCCRIRFFSCSCSSF
jgi:hypothetical protein